MSQDLYTIKLYKMLKDISEIFDTNNIKYWADGGTFLGAIRNKGIIPWDDDLDIGILEGSLSKIFVDLKKQIENKGYNIINQNFGYKVFPIDGQKIKIDPWKKHCDNIKKKYKTISRSKLYKIASKTYKKTDQNIYHNYKYPFLDVFEYKNKDNKLITKGDDSWWTNKCYYNTMKLNKLREKKFSNFKIKVMPDYQRYFDSCYGSDWNIYGYTSGWDHKKERHTRNKDKIKFRLTKKHREPKKPFYI